MVTMGFTKLDENILQSSVMHEDDCTFKVWIALLAACKENGVAPVSLIYIASICRKTNSEIEKSIKILEAPDKFSRSTNDDGRRIRRVDGGYEIINYKKYRSFTYSGNKDAVRKRIYRGHSRDMSHNDGDISASASASASASDLKKAVVIPPHLTEIWPDFLAMRKTLRKPATDRAQKNLLAKLDEMAPNDTAMQIKIVEQSITNSWQGFFELKANFKDVKKEIKPLSERVPL